MAEAQFFAGLFYQHVSSQTVIDPREPSEGGNLLLLETPEIITKNETSETVLILENTEAVLI